jgi:hypothetical protein
VRCLEIAGQETYLDRRCDYALAALFAEAVDRQDQWRKVVEKLKMKEPSIVLEWKANARREGKIDLLELVLKGRFAPLPEDLVARLRSTTDSALLDRWATLAGTAPTLDQFRQDAGL